MASSKDLFCSTSVAFYSDRTNAVDCIFTGDFKATTHLQFSSDGTKLFSAGRKSSEICCWDVRNPGKLLAKLVRPMDLNHKANFDIDRLGTILKDFYSRIENLSSYDYCLSERLLDCTFEKVDFFLKEENCGIIKRCHLSKNPHV